MGKKRGTWKGNLRSLLKRLLSVPYKDYFPEKGSSLLKVSCNGFPTKINRWEPLLFEGNGISREGSERNIKEVTSLSDHLCRPQCNCCCYIVVCAVKDIWDFLRRIFTQVAVHVVLPLVVLQLTTIKILTAQPSSTRHKSIRSAHGQTERQSSYTSAAKLLNTVETLAKRTPSWIM